MKHKLEQKRINLRIRHAVAKAKRIHVENIPAHDYCGDLGIAIRAIDSLNVNPQDFNRVVDDVIGHRSFWCYTPAKVCECIMRYEDCPKCGMSLWDCELSECKGGI